jgi:hypothetical protein
MFPGISPLPSSPIVFANSISYTTPGTFSFVCPEFNTMNVIVNAGGGGGATFVYVNGSTFQFITTNNDGTNGGNSSIFGLLAVGGTVGAEGSRYINGPGYPGPTSRTPGANGANGTASGGDTNTTGGGAAGGVGGSDDIGRMGGNGGNGGKTVKTYNAGDLIPGQTYTVVVGAGGNGETQISQSTFSNANGHIGTSGNVSLSWS